MQALEYIEGLADEEKPSFILVSDFEKFVLYDLVKPDSSVGKQNSTANGEQKKIRPSESVHRFSLQEFPEKIKLFSFMIGGEQKDYKKQLPVTIRAAERMGKLHDTLKRGRYKADDLHWLLVRLVYCLFAEDTGVFELPFFEDFIERTYQAGWGQYGATIDLVISDAQYPSRRKANQFE